VLIQFGAILALLSIYFFRIWQLAIGMFKDPAAQRFIIGVLIAFLPAALVGAVAHDFIKAVLFNVWIVCFTLIVGGAILLWVDRMDLETRYHDATKFSLPMYFFIGLAQCVSMIPGVSRSGATIVSAMLLGADRASAAEFSFWLAMPTMAGAFAYDLYKSRAQMSMDNSILVAVGFAVSFMCALDRGEDVSWLRAAPRLRAVRLVARRRRIARPDRAGARLLSEHAKARWADREPGHAPFAPIRSPRGSPPGRRACP
jgi:undecaprenyl-diphosphatase